MGLLDQFFGTPEQTQALGLLGAGLMQGNPGAGFQNATQFLAQAPDVQLKRQMMMEDLSMKRLQEQRAQAMFKMQQDAYNGIGQDGGMGAPAAPAQPSIAPSMGGALGSGTYGIPMGGQSATAPQAMAPQSNIGAQLQRLERMAIAGVPGAKESLDILKYRNDPQKVDAGGYTRNPVTGQMTYNVDPKVGLGIDAQGNIIRAPGSENIAGMAGDAASAQETAKARLDPLSQSFVDRRTGLPIGGSRYDYLNPGQPQAPGGALPVGNGASLTPELMQRIRADAQQNGITNPQFNFQPPKGMSAATFGSLPPSLAKQPVQLQSPAEAKAAESLATGQATNFTGYQSQLNKDVTTGYQQFARNQQIRQLLQDYQTGLSAPDARTTFASNLVNAFPGNGTVKAFAEKVNGGNVGNAQELANLLSAAGLTNVIRTLDGNGRVNKAEYQALQEHAENNRTDPSAMEGIMAYQDHVYQQQFAEQQALAKAIKSGNLNPATWEADYSQLRHDQQASGPTPPTPAQATKPPAGKTVVRTGMYGGKKVIQYSDGTTSYAN